MNIKEKLLPALAAALCAWAMAVGNILCLVTSFDLPVSTGTILALCGICAALWSGLFTLKDRRPVRAVTALALALFLGAVAHVLLFGGENAFIDALFAAVQPILTRYINVFPVFSGIDPIEYVPEGADATVFFSALGVLVTYLAARTVLRRESVLPAALLSGLLLAACFLILQTTPDAWCLLTLIWSYLILAICRVGRARLCGASAALAAAVPTAALLIALFFLIDPAYGGHPEGVTALRTEIDAFISRTVNSLFRSSSGDGAGGTGPGGTTQPQATRPAPFRSSLGSFSWNRDVSRIDLSAVGRRSSNSTPVMTVLASQSGTLYLRGSSLGVYDGSGWTQLPDDQIDQWSDGTFLWLAGGAGNTQTVTVTTNQSSFILFLPYRPTGFPEGYELFGDVHVLNNAGLTEYTVSYIPDAPSDSLPSDYGSFVQSAYTQVPDSTRLGLVSILAQLGRDPDSGIVVTITTADSAARLVGDYVSSSARYSLNTPAMPAGADFVLWFLNESDTGYCVHFASAAVMLLRCMGVPARLVTGYMVDAVAGQPVTVTQNDAHAWAEYYVNGYGWKILEATPGYTAPAETEPAETVQPTRATEPPETGATEPPETQPAETLSPDGPTETAPETTDALPGEDNAPGESSFALPPAVTAALTVLAALALLYAVYALARWLWLSHGGVNVRAVKYYKQIVFLSRLTSRPVPEEALDLARAARFGPRELTPEQLAGLTGIYARLREHAVKKQGGARGLLVRLLLPR